MRKVIFMVLMAVGIAVSASAVKPLQVQSFEGEVWVGWSIPPGSYHGGKAASGVSLGLNLRQNVKGTPFDYGIFLSLDCAKHKFGHFSSGYDITQNNRTLALGLTGAYNFRQGHKVNPFAGIGIGVGWHDVVNTRVYPSSGTSAVFVPKVGVELLSFLRFNAYFQLSRRGYNNFGLSVGLTLGGRPKK